MIAHNTHTHPTVNRNDASAHLSQVDFAGRSDAMRKSDEDVPEILRKILIKRGWTQAELARRLDVTQPTISRIISGSEPKYEHRLRIMSLARQSTVINNTDGSGVTETAQKSREVFIVATVGVSGVIHILPKKRQELAPLPPGGADSNIVAAKVVGDGMMPVLRDGWLIYWDKAQEAAFPRTESVAGKLCVVCCIGGQILLRTVLEGRAPGKFDLFAANAEPLLNQAVDWIAKVIWILPT